MSLVLQSFLPFPHSCQGPSPHQQGRDERMIEQCFGGIDVSQDRLDVLLLPQGTGFSVANDEAGWSTLIGRLRGLLLTAIGLEPSGGYERGVLRALLAAGLSVRRINPNRLRQFARARGALAKNDRLDARLIAEYVATMPTHVVRHDPAAARIAEIVTTDTVPLPPEKQLPNIVVRSVAPLFAEAVRRTHLGESVSSLFSSEETYG